MTTVIVYGPPGCGKTTHKLRLAGMFRTPKIVDEWVAQAYVEPDTLYLTQRRPKFDYPSSVKVVSFEEATRNWT